MAVRPEAAIDAVHERTLKVGAVSITACREKPSPVSPGPSLGGHAPLSIGRAIMAIMPADDPANPLDLYLDRLYADYLVTCRMSGVEPVPHANCPKE